MRFCNILSYLVGGWAVLARCRLRLFQRGRMLFLCNRTWYLPRHLACMQGWNFRVKDFFRFLRIFNRMLLFSENINFGDYNWQKDLQFASKGRYQRRSPPKGPNRSHNRSDGCNFFHRSELRIFGQKSLTQKSQPWVCAPNNSVHFVLIRVEKSVNLLINAVLETVYRFEQLSENV